MQVLVLLKQLFEGLLALGAVAVVQLMVISASQVPDLPICSGIINGADDTINQAIIQEDYSLCYELEESVECRTQDGKGGDDKPWIRSNANPQYVCLNAYAEVAEGTEACEVMELSGRTANAYQCTLDLAEESGDITYCEMLDGWEINKCLAFMTLDPQYCLDIDYEIDWSDNEEERLKSVNSTRSSCIVSLVYRTQEIAYCDLVHNDGYYDKCIIALAVDETPEDRQVYCDMMRATTDWYVREQQECYDMESRFRGELGGYY